MSENANRSQHQASNNETLDFSCEYSSNIPEILARLNISLAVTSYQTGRLILVRSDGHSLDVNYKHFERPMGLTVDGDTMTMGVFTQVVSFQREDILLDKLKKPLQRIEDDITAPRVTDVADEGDTDEALERYRQQQYEPVSPNVDACFLSRSTHFTGMINIHDIGWGEQGLWVVNSSFSCLCTLEPGYSFTPKWKPHFISELVPEDRCHLNGMALKDGAPAYVTTFSTFDHGEQWRKQSSATGTLMSVEENEILVDGLMMPHSPRWYQDRVYFCHSGVGQLCTYHPQTAQTEIVAEYPGFTRGIDFYGPILFVGVSKVRVSDAAKVAPLMQKYDETMSGIALFNLDNKKEIGFIQFKGNIDQIYDVAVITNSHFPEVIEPNHPRMRNHFCYPKL
tara:strand:+ start:3506 stop:4690 length:1185 start_codon:yes stop_codon:yes gene_type:complete